jgi:hypothetical protein
LQWRLRVFSLRNREFTCYIFFTCNLCLEGLIRCELQFRGSDCVCFAPKTASYQYSGPHQAESLTRYENPLLFEGAALAMTSVASLHRKIRVHPASSLRRYQGWAGSCPEPVSVQAPGTQLSPTKFNEMTQK